MLILDVPLAADTKKKKPTIPDIPKIAAKGSNVKENIKNFKIKINNSFSIQIKQLLLSIIGYMGTSQYVKR